MYLFSYWIVFPIHIKLKMWSISLKLFKHFTPLPSSISSLLFFMWNILYHIYYKHLLTLFGTSFVLGLLLLLLLLFIIIIIIITIKNLHIIFLEFILNEPKSSIFAAHERTGKDGGVDWNIGLTSHLPSPTCLWTQKKFLKLKRRPFFM